MMFVEVYRSDDGLPSIIHLKSTFDILIIIDDTIRVMVFQSIVHKGIHSSQTLQDHYTDTVLIFVCGIALFYCLIVYSGTIPLKNVIITSMLKLKMCMEFNKYVKQYS